MSNAPKKIWIDMDYPDLACLADEERYATQTDTPYVRADIVDELVEALEVLLKLHDNEVFVKEPWDVSMEQARAAIAKAKGEADETQPSD